LTVRIVGADEGLALNQRFRQQAHATNVLTFDYQHSPVIVADLVLTAPVVAQEAHAQRTDLVAHYAHLLVHGALHAQGMDHARARDAKRMQARETEVLALLGFGDPYTR
jgi:probable rRNA maturation factor